MDWLLMRFAAEPAREAMVWHDQGYTYGWLLDRVGWWSAELEARGVASGTVFALRGDYSPEVCALLLALIERGAIIVPLASTAEANVSRFQDIAEVQAGVG